MADFTQAIKWLNEGRKIKCRMWVSPNVDKSSLDYAL